MTNLKMRVRTLGVFIFAMLLGTSAAFAQLTVNGTVSDPSGEPLIGVSVVEKGKTGGVTTDIDGHFQIRVADDAVLSFSYVGYVSRDLAAQPTMNVVLEEDNNLLSEVVVVGYGVQKKSVVTAAISQVTADDLEATAPLRMDNALKGLASGVNVTSSSGQPGAAARVRIRGVGTINNSDPLYIVDGMPIEGGLDYLNPTISRV